MLPPPLLQAFVSIHVPPSSVSINLYDTQLHLTNVSGLDRIPVQKFLIKPVLYVYRWANYNLTGLIKHWREKGEMEHVLWPLPLSPVSISISAYLPPSPPPRISLFVPRSSQNSEGDGREIPFFGSSWWIHRCQLFVLNTPAPLRWHVLATPLDSQLWLLRCMELPARQLLQIWVIHLCSYQHLSSFRYWRKQSSRTLQSIAHTGCIISPFLHSFVGSLENSHFAFVWRSDGEQASHKHGWTLSTKVTPTSPETTKRDFVSCTERSTIRCTKRAFVIERLPVLNQYYTVFPCMYVITP